eukprot:g58265.t1
MEIDYLPLRDEPTPLQAVSRGAVRLLSLALGGLACAQWARTHFFWNRTSQPESSQPFMPHSGVRSVSVKPGYPGLMQAASWLSAPSCLFFYNNRLVDDEFGEDASRAQPARMYGAKLFRIQETGALPFAVPTGNPSDSVEGRLLCWTSRQFRAKLKKADQLLQYPTHAKDKARGEWRRHVLTVVREDGSEANAWWYYKDAVPVGKFTVEPHDQNSWGTLAAVGKLLGNMKATADREMQEMTQNVLAGPVASLARQVYKTDGEVQDGINALLFLVVDTTLSILQKDDLRGELSVCATVLQFRAGVTCTTEKTDGYSLTRILQEQEERLIKKGNENSFGSKILHGLIRATGGEVGHKTNSTTEEEVTKAVEVALSTLLSRLYRLANGMKVLGYQPAYAEFKIFYARNDPPPQHLPPKGYELASQFNALRPLG